MWLTSFLRALASAATLTRETKNVHSRSISGVYSPHHLSDLISHKIPPALMTPLCLQQIHLILIQDLLITTSTSNHLNLASLLPMIAFEVLQMTPTPSPHMNSTPLYTASDTWFMVRSLTNTDIQKRPGYIVNGSKVIEASPLPSGTSSQKNRT